MPFISEHDKDFYTNASGGYWGSVEKKALKKIGEGEKLFNFFGWNGPCASGAVVVKLPISVWTYTNLKEIY